jgi:hypothetical protein
MAELKDPTVSHGKPTDGMMCMVSYEDITEEEKNYVEFQSAPSMKWKACQFEKDTVQQLLDTQFSSYMNRVKKTDCQAELRRLLEAGPPVWLSDANGFPMDEGETHVENLWYAEDNKERSARLKVSEEGEAKRGGRINSRRRPHVFSPNHCPQGSVVGAERDKLLESLKEFVVVEGKEEGDDDDKKEGTK